MIVPVKKLEATKPMLQGSNEITNLYPQHVDDIARWVVK